MSISILNRGASGGLKPELIVIARSGSTIDLLQNGIIVATYTLGADETEHTFVVKVGTYTVRGTLDKVQSKEIAIDTVGQYSVTIDYKLWLYREGEEFEEVTGGWIAVRSQPNNSSYPMGTTTKNADNLYARAQNQSAGWSTTNAIDVTGYTKLKAIITASGTYNRMNLYDTTPDKVIAGRDNNYGTEEEFTADISSVNGSYKVHLGCFTTGGSGVATMTIYKVWLE